SRNGISTSYHATYQALQKYAKHDGDQIIQLGTDRCRAAVGRSSDNIQKYLHPRDYRVGHEAHMLIVTAATVFEIEGFTPGMLDLGEKREWLARNTRQSFTFDKLQSLIDYQHLDVAFTIQWIKSLCHMEEDLRATTGAKHRIPPRKTKIFLLPTNGYNETMVSELIKVIRDIFGHLRQTKESYIQHLLLLEGDGLTYERMVQLKNYLQFLEYEFDRMDLLEPFLEIWHTVWTDLSRIYQAHWVSLKSRDPSSMGYGANRIKRKAPGNLGKIDYYPYSDLLHLELEARILDIWNNEFKTQDITNHFKDLAIQDKLPTFEELQDLARTLHL
ncbi:hypothetical protein ARMSODRAFT_984083, partial [Armillaria solidipes]